MTGRLLYHFFWNFYDHLGVLALAGVVQALASMAAIACLLWVSPYIPLPVSVGLATATSGLLLAVPSAGMLYFAAKAAGGETARLPDFIAGIRHYWARVLLVTILFAAAALITVVNARFYFSVDTQQTSRGVQFGAMLLAGLHGWLLVLLAYLAAPVFCAVTAGESNVAPQEEESYVDPDVPQTQPSPQKLSLRHCLRRALFSVALTPSIWIIVLLSGVILLALCWWSKIGLLVYLPLMAVMAQTAFFLSGQYAGFLAKAKHDLGPTASYRNLKSHAFDMALQWEHAQPRRTAKELIRPWEY
jgi:hypothetical protein